jgi:hypothetical protein
MPDVGLIWSIVELALKDRGQLALENAALRHQLAVRKRSVKRARVQDSDRIFWMLLRRSLKDWKNALIFVKPDTVVRWHRQGFRYFWKRKSRSAPGRPLIRMAIIMLIKRLSRENETWGAPHIVDELALLGHTVSETTVARYMARHRETERSQSWRTFIQNHLHETAACDFFTVPTATFKVLHCFVVLSLDRRRILHVNVTSHPTAAWTARQLLEAFPTDSVPRFLMRDRDGTRPSPEPGGLPLSYRRASHVLALGSDAAVRWDTSGQRLLPSPTARRALSHIRGPRLTALQATIDVASRTHRLQFEVAAIEASGCRDRNHPFASEAHTEPQRTHLGSTLYPNERSRPRDSEVGDESSFHDPVTKRAVRGTVVHSALF